MEHQIQFTSEMVRAILGNYKHQTRRVARVTDVRCNPGFITPVGYHVPRRIAEHAAYCPYGRPGDRLWVREGWRTEPKHDALSPREIPPGAPLLFEADDERRTLDRALWGRYRPAMFMPRWASRLTLEITVVRVQRLQEISTGDAMAEGVDLPEQFPWRPDYCPYRDSFSRLWDSINAKRGFGWDVNPWVWAISFLLLTPHPSRLTAKPC